MLLSVLVALILTPVLCATFLKPVPKGHQPSENVVFFLRPFFRVFDKVFYKARAVYVGMRVGFAKQRSGPETVHNHGQGGDLFAYLA